MSEAHTYVVGLPVVVDIQKDGAVVLSVAIEDLTTSLGDGEEPYTDEQVRTDTAIVDAAIEAGRVSVKLD